MKNVLKISLILAVFLTAFGASANEKDFSLRVKSEKGKMVSFSINEAKNISLSIYGKNNETLFDEIITSNGTINRTYDLNAFPEGNYILEVETDAKIAQYEIQISSATASISETAKSEIFKPVLKKGDGFIALNIAKLGKSPIEVQVYDENNTLLYSETFTDKENFATRFDTKSTNADQLTFVVRYKDQIFSETLVPR